MENAKNTGNHYKVNKNITCIGCKFLNRRKQGCTKDQPPGKVKPLNTYLNASGFYAILRSCDGGYQDIRQKKPATDGA